MFAFRHAVLGFTPIAPARSEGPSFYHTRQTAGKEVLFIGPLPFLSRSRPDN
jgi:hypothetical protein